MRLKLNFFNHDLSSLSLLVLIYLFNTFESDLSEFTYFRSSDNGWSSFFLKIFILAVREFNIFFFLIVRLETFEKIFFFRLIQIIWRRIFIIIRLILIRKSLINNLHIVFRIILWCLILDIFNGIYLSLKTLWIVKGRRSQETKLWYIFIFIFFICNLFCCVCTWVFHYLWFSTQFEIIFPIRTLIWAFVDIKLWR
jgi:hypothetical protein